MKREKESPVAEAYCNVTRGGFSVTWESWGASVSWIQTGSKSVLNALFKKPKIVHLIKKKVSDFINTIKDKTIDFSIRCIDVYASLFRCPVSGTNQVSSTARSSSSTENRGQLRGSTTTNEDRMIRFRKLKEQTDFLSDLPLCCFSPALCSGLLCTVAMALDSYHYPACCSAVHIY